MERSAFFPAGKEDVYDRMELKNLSAIQGDTEQETPTNKKGF